jgi:predicted nucleic acid-binding protein
VSLVVDASVAFEWFLFEESHASQAVAVLQDGATLIALDLLIAEVCNAAWRSARLGRISRRAQGGGDRRPNFVLAGFDPAIHGSERSG